MKIQRSSCLFAVIILMLLLGCSKKSPDEQGYQVTADLARSKAEILQGQSMPPGQPVPVERRLIKEGELTFECRDTAEARGRIDRAVKKFGAYIADESSASSGDRVTQRLVVRVPAANFEALVDEISRDVKNFDSREIRTNDATEEFIDIEARLKNKKEVEKRYRDLLGQAKKVEDILSIERQLGELRGEIESIEGRLKFLQQAVAYSTLTVAFYENVSVPVSFMLKCAIGLKEGWNNLIRSLIALTYVWPFLIIGGAFVFWLVHRRRRKKAKAPQ